MFKILDLFSGIGGFSLGLENTGGFETAAFCEIDPYARAVLQKHWPGVPIFEDVRELKADAIEPVHIICGGYPCQPFSQAGKRGGEKDDRHLWPEMHRLVASIRPRWVIAENVAGHISMGLDQVLSDLEGEGYTCWPLVIPACAVDAPHRRDRVWVVGHASSAGSQARGRDRVGTANGPQGNKEQSEGSSGEAWAMADAKSGLLTGDIGREGQAGGFEGCSEDVADARHARIYERREPGHAEKEGRQPRRMVENGVQGRDGAEREAVADAGSGRHGTTEKEILPRGHGAKYGGEDAADADSTGRKEQRGAEPDGEEHEAPERGGGWLPEPNVGRVAHGVPSRVDRLKALGNAVVPQVVEQIGRAILEAEKA